MYFIKNGTLPTINDYNQSEIKNMRLYMATLIIEQQSSAVNNIRISSRLLKNTINSQTKNNSIISKQQAVDYYDNLKNIYTKDLIHLT